MKRLKTERIQKWFIDDDEKLETQNMQSFVEHYEKTNKTKNPMVCRQPHKDQKLKKSNGL